MFKYTSYGVVLFLVLFFGSFQDAKAATWYCSGHGNVTVWTSGGHNYSAGTKVTNKSSVYRAKYTTNGYQSLSNTGYWENLGTCVSTTPPSVTTQGAQSVTSSAGTMRGHLSNTGGATTTRYIQWGYNPSYGSGGQQSVGTGSTGYFSFTKTGLAPGTRIYYRAYACNSAGCSYGSQTSFLTLSVAPSITTTAISGITSSSAASGGTSINAGGASILEKGLVYVVGTGTPTTSNSKINKGTGTGNFTHTITGLSPNTTYSVRAYAINSAGTSYGAKQTFTTNANPATITTDTPTSITMTSILAGGSSISAGGATILEKGLVYVAGSGTPTTSDTKINKGTGTSSFTHTISGLSSGTQYSIRAYAINSAGTSYGAKQTFTTEFPDSDGDGAGDNLDTHPSDPDIAAMSYYPSEGQWNTLAFEDLWPNKGDFDLNDFVANYQVIEYINTSNNVKRLDFKMKLKARGGIKHKGFAVEIDGTTAANLDSIKGYLDGEPYNVIVEESVGSLIVVFIKDLKFVLPGTETTQFYNTESGDNRPIRDFEVRYYFATHVGSGYDQAPFNPFIFSTGIRSDETHLSDHAPTTKHDSGLFGTLEDDTRIGEGRYYRTAQGLPWGLDIPGDWDHTVEGTDIVEAYPSITDWAQSSGATHTLWYQNKVIGKVR